MDTPVEMTFPKLDSYERNKFQFQSQLETYSNEDDLSSQSFLKSLTTESIEDDSHADYAKVSATRCFDLP